MLRGSLSGGLFDPRDERLIHRLEAFSDIVIGFSMAFLAVNLGGKDLPLAQAWPHLVAFVGCFGVVALLWWLHNRLFAYYFVANAATIVINFAALAGVALFIYTSTDIAEKFVNAAHLHVRDVTQVLSLWMGLYGVVLVLLAMLFGIGLRARWGELAYPVKRWGVARALNAGIGGTALIVFSALIPRVAVDLYVYVFLPVFLLLIAERVLTERIVGKVPA